MALAVTSELIRRGIPAHLDVIGCSPALSPSAPATVHGFLSKMESPGLLKISRLCERAHFLLLPTRRDCTPAAIAEAALFGVPTLARNVGGIGTMIQDRVSGGLFDESADFREYADFIEKTLSDAGQYPALARGAFEMYRSKLNWTSAVARVSELIVSVL